MKEGVNRLRSKKIMALLLSLVMVVALLLVPATASESPGADGSAPQFSVENFEARSLETDAGVLGLNERAELTLQERSGIALENTERAFDTLIKSLYEAQSDDQKYREGSYTVSGITKDGFPESYAGAYVNDDLNLVVLLTESTTKTKSALLNSQLEIAKLAESNDLIYASAKYSYRHLVSLMDDIYQYVVLPDEEKNDRVSVIYYYIDDASNCVVVGLTDVGAESIAAFKKTVSNSDTLRFVLADDGDLSTPTSALDAGIGLYNSSGNLKGSVGFRVRLLENGSYIDGFVTAGHCFNPGEYIYYGGNIVARAHATKWQFGGNKDAVFCMLLSGHSVTSTLAYTGGTYVAGIDVNLAVGNPVTMRGAGTKGASTSNGTVTSLTGSGSYTTGQTYADHVLASYLSVGGDSGGIVVSTRTGSNYISGVTSGSISSTSPYSSNYTKAQNITTGFGLTFN